MEKRRGKGRIAQDETFDEFLDSEAMLAETVDRLLDPKNPSVTLATLRRAAFAVGRSLRVELV